MRSGPVKAVKFASEGIVASSSTDGSTKLWDLSTGQETEKTAEAVPKGFTFPKEGGAKDQKVGGYVVAAKGRTLVIHKARKAGGKAGTETPVAFFQCASEITAFDVAGANVAVACADGQVLQLFAAVLQP